MHLICPKNKKHKLFSVTAHEVHDWTVDEDGEFVADMGCSEMAHRPDANDSYHCLKCGAVAKVRS